MVEFVKVSQVQLSVLGPAAAPKDSGFPFQELKYKTLFKDVVMRLLLNLTHIAVAAEKVHQLPQEDHRGQD